MTADDDPLAVKLDRGEVHLAAMMGCLRQIDNIFAEKQSYIDEEQGEGFGWAANIEGCLGEIAFAKWSKRYWGGNLGNYKADDVGPYQVRTRSKHEYELPIYPRDRPDRYYVLLTGTVPEYRVRGYVWGADGKRPEFYTRYGKGRPAFYVPYRLIIPLAPPKPKEMTPP